MVEKIDDDVGSGKVILSVVENIQIENVEMDDVDDVKFVKIIKKKKLKRIKILVKEDIMFVFGVQNVEVIEVVDGEGIDNVIRNVLDFLQENDEIAGNVDIIVKKLSKKSKKKYFLKVVEF